jgi:predicted RNA methylase
MFSEVWHHKGGFDVVIGNPPYGVSKKGEERRLIVNTLGKVPDYEIYYFFIERAKSLLKNEGVSTYIIPNTILFNVYAGSYREKIATDWQILEILDCTQFPLFESAVVRNIIFSFRKNNAPKTEISFRNTTAASTFTSLVTKKRESMPVKKLLTFNQNWGLAFKLDKNVTEAITTIRENSTPLSELCPDISQGLIAYDKYRGQATKIIESRAFHYDQYKPGLKKWLKGGDVTRYCVSWNGKNYIDYCNGIANPRDPKFFVGARVLVREITNPSLFAAFTTEELYNDPSILIIKTDSGSVPGLALEAILNSELSTFYHFNFSPKATKGEFPKILITDLKNFPIKNVLTKSSRFLVVLSEYLKVLSPGIEKRRFQYSFYDQLISGLVYELYFPDELKAAGKEILRHLGELPPIDSPPSQGGVPPEGGGRWFWNQTTPSGCACHPSFTRRGV